MGNWMLCSYEKILFFNFFYIFSQCWYRTPWSNWPCWQELMSQLGQFILHYISQNPFWQNPENRHELIAVNQRWIYGNHLQLPCELISFITLRHVYDRSCIAKAKCNMPTLFYILFYCQCIMWYICVFFMITEYTKKLFFFFWSLF